MVDKLKVASYTAHNSIDNFELGNVESIKDLGVIFDSHLKFELLNFE